MCECVGRQKNLKEASVAASKLDRTLSLTMFVDHRR